MMKILSIVGARPQFVKVAAIKRAVERRGDIEHKVVHTGQHYDQNMSDVFFHELGIEEPDYSLGVGSAGHGAMTGRMLEKIEEILLSEKPDWVMVYGDTNSTLAGALAATKIHIPVTHVEAGLRSFNRKMPEEINRVASDHISDLLLVPTKTAVKNLRREGIEGEMVSQVGDVMYDIAIYASERAEQTSDVLDRLGLIPNGYVLSTIHRAENTDDSERLKSIFSGLNEVAEQMPVVMPMHPRTRSTLNDLGVDSELFSNLHIVEPVGYMDMVMLEKNAAVIATDSGGVQKEAYFFQVPCVTLRDETEWIELVEHGYNQLVGADREALIEAVTNAIQRTEPWPETELYGKGNAADCCIESILSFDKQRRS